MLKKYTDFTNENAPVKKDVEKTISKRVPVNNCDACNSEKNVQTKKVDKKPNMKEVEKEVKEQFELIGKIAVFPSEIKPSVSMVMLENNNISKNKLHYIISKQTIDTISLFKYNENSKMNLTEFVKNIINYYKLNENNKNIFEKINVEGNSQYVILKNIPDVKFTNNENLIDLLKNNIIKLLK
jgi:hypothetical protein